MQFLIFSAWARSFFVMKEGGCSMHCRVSQSCFSLSVGPNPTPQWDSQAASRHCLMSPRWSRIPRLRTTFFFLILLYLFGCARSSPQHVGSSVVACKLSWSLWDLVPWPGMKPRPSASGARNLSPWITSEVLRTTFYTKRGIGLICLNSTFHFSLPVLVC